MRAPAHPQRRHPARRFVILGVLTLAVIGAAVFISYRANSGLPWQSHYQLYVDVPDANRVVHYDEVRIGGIRVGEVETVEAVTGNGRSQPFARLQLSLSPSVDRLPVDTTVQIRSASLLGASYVALKPGRSRQTIPSGGTLPQAKALGTTQLTDLLNMFDRGTARSMQDTITGLGDGLAGRGADLNATIATLRRLMTPMTGVMHTVSSPSANLPRFLRGYEAMFNALAGSRFPSLMADGATTFAAFNDAGAAPGRALDAFPAAEATTATALTDLRPGLASFSRLMVQLRPGMKLLPGALPALNRALRAGIPALGQLPLLARPLRTTLETLTAVSRRPATDGAVRKLTDAVDAVGVLLDAVVPAQLQCNVFGLFGRNLEMWLVGTGIAAGAFGQDGIATSGAHDEAGQQATPSSNMHANPDPVEDYQRCESGNEPFDPNAYALGNPSGPISNHVPSTSPPADAVAHTPPGTP